MAICNSLSQQELEELVRDPCFFLADPSLGSQKEGGSEPSLSGASDEVEASPEDGLVEFFTIPREEKAMPVGAFVQKLRARLAPVISPRGGTPSSVVVRGRGGGHLGDDSTEEEAILQACLSYSDLGRMPCQGRQPACRFDEASPTLARVREVYNRRDTADAKWVRDQQEAMIQRAALNAFKAREQQREATAQFRHHHALHNARIQECQARKVNYDAGLKRRTEIAEAESLGRLDQAVERAEDILEAKREHATEVLERWQENVEKAEQYRQQMEHDLFLYGQQSMEVYRGKLYKMGMAKLNRGESQAHKNDVLKTRIQASLSAQQREVQRQREDHFEKKLESKLEGAAARRWTGQRGARYNFVEKAFGSEAYAFDVKHHTVSVDRRGPSWKKTIGQSSEPSLSRTFSSPPKKAH